MKECFIKALHAEGKKSPKAYQGLASTLTSYEYIIAQFLENVNTRTPKRRPFLLTKNDKYLNEIHGGSP